MMREISDLSLSAYLSITNHKLVKLTQFGRKILFCFEESPSLEADILKYYNRAATVDPLTYSEILRNFKGLTKNQGGNLDG